MLQVRGRCHPQDKRLGSLTLDFLRRCEPHQVPRVLQMKSQPYFREKARHPCQDCEKDVNPKKPDDKEKMQECRNANLTVISRSLFESL